MRADEAVFRLPVSAIGANSRAQGPERNEPDAPELAQTKLDDGRCTSSENGTDETSGDVRCDVRY